MNRARLDRARSHVRRRMLVHLTDTCRVDRDPLLNRDGALDEETLTIAVDDTAPVFEGPCQVRPQGGGDAQVLVVGQHEQGKSDWRAALPITADQVRRDDILTVTASPDPWLVGKTFDVREVLGGGLATRRLVLERRD